MSADDKAARAARRRERASMPLRIAHVWHWHLGLLVGRARCDRVVPGDVTCFRAAEWLRAHHARDDGSFADPRDARWYDLWRRQVADGLYWALSSSEPGAADFRDALAPIFDVLDTVTQRDAMRAEAERRH